MCVLNAVMRTVSGLSMTGQIQELQISNFLRPRLRRAGRKLRMLRTEAKALGYLNEHWERRTSNVQRRTSNASPVAGLFRPRSRRAGREQRNMRTEAEALGYLNEHWESRTSNVQRRTSNASPVAGLFRPRSRRAGRAQRMLRTEAT